jgi:hypothetical protein
MYPDRALTVVVVVYKYFTAAAEITVNPIVTGFVGTDLVVVGCADSERYSVDPQNFWSACRCTTSLSMRPIENL